MSEESGSYPKMIELRMKTGVGCEIFADGERMVISGQEVVLKHSDRVCAAALSCVFQEAAELASSAAGKEGAPLGEVGCAGESCSGIFEVYEFVRPKKTGSITRRITKAAREEAPRGPFLSRLPPDLLRQLLESCKVRQYDEKTEIIHEGQEGRELYFVGGGEAEVVVAGGSKDHEVVVAVLGKGECFGEMSLLTGDPASANVRALPGASILAMTKDDLDGFLARSPKLSTEFSRLIAERLRRTSISLGREGSRGITGRLSMISFPDLVQTLHASHRTGTLSINKADGSGRVGFDEGHVSGVVVGDKKGNEAFLVLFLWPDGDFLFEAGEVLSDGSVTMPTMGLLMEGVRRQDEAGKKA